jgi:hypothetical protein
VLGNTKHSHSHFGVRPVLMKRDMIAGYFSASLKQVHAVLLKLALGTSTSIENGAGILRKQLFHIKIQLAGEVGILFVFALCRRFHA